MGLVAGFVLVAPVLLYAWSLPAIATLNVGFMNLDQSFEGQRFARTADIAATIAALTERDDFVVTDEPEQAFHAQRLVPPNLADPSTSRVRARELTGSGRLAVPPRRCYGRAKGRHSSVGRAPDL